MSLIWEKLETKQGERCTLKADNYELQLTIAHEKDDLWNYQAKLLIGHNGKRYFLIRSDYAPLDAESAKLRAIGVARRAIMIAKAQLDSLERRLE